VKKAHLPLANHGMILHTGIPGDSEKKKNAISAGEITIFPMVNHG